MREGWERRRIADILEPVATVDPRKKPAEVFTYIDVSAVSRETHQVVETSRLNGKDAPSRARRLVRAGDVIFATIRPTLQRIAEIPAALDGAVCSTGYFVLRPKPIVLTRFLFYCLFTEQFSKEIAGLQRGAAYPAVSDTDVRAREIFLPSLLEQKRIVAILDEAFAGIATAVANTEKNLANARELFESYLNSVFSQRGASWKSIKFSEAVSTIRPPRKVKRNEFQDSGPFPIVSQEQGLVNGRWSVNNDVIHVDRPVIVFGDHTRVFKYIDFDFVAGADGIKIFRPVHFLNAKYLYYFAQTVPLKGLGYARHYRILKDIDIWYPDELADQEAIVDRAEELLSDVNRLRVAYAQKLVALAELKQSLLQKAFSGELTATPRAEIEAALA